MQNLTHPPLSGISLEEYENASNVTSPKSEYHLGTVVFSDNEMNYSLRFDTERITNPNDYTAMRGESVHGISGGMVWSTAKADAYIWWYGL